VEAAKIVGVAVVGAVLYGVLHDQVTARISVEYFTIGHPRVVDSTSPTVLAFVWGVLATWWVGVLLGLAWAVAARAGSRPKAAARDFVRPALVLFGVAAVCAAIAGVVGNALARSGDVFLLEPLASRVPPERHVAFLTALWAHLAAYGAAAVGGIVVAARAWRRRGAVVR
jgi:hypothetical protein